MYQRFDYEKRKQLEKYMKVMVSTERIAELFDISRASVYNELHNGLEDPSGKDFTNYSADLAQKRVEDEIFKRLRGVK
ncbi:putative DNA-binding protein YlxM (UPF0122 family) [Clostridiales Family XIII bacterium PM5-7]